MFEAQYIKRARDCSCVLVAKAASLVAARLALLVCSLRPLACLSLGGRIALRVNFDPMTQRLAS